MSAGIDMSNGRANMAHAKGTPKPWWGIGFEVDANASIEEWQRAAGLNFEVLKGELLFRDSADVIHEASKALNRSVLYRSDTLAPLSVMSKNRYHIHQPADILAFISDVSKATGWPVETAGSLYGGRKIWALLKVPVSFTLPGGDVVEGYLLASTSFDGSSGSDFRFICTRVVCANTLHMGLSEKVKHATVVYHDTVIDVQRVKADLGMAAEPVWTSFIETAKQLASIKLTRSQAVSILRKVYDDTPIVSSAVRVPDEQFILDNPTPRRILGLYEGAGLGSNLASALNTGWGLVNAVTQDTDHFGSNRNSRLNSAWFGPGAARKQAVVEAVLDVAA